VGHATARNKEHGTRGGGSSEVELGSCGVGRGVDGTVASEEATSDPSERPHWSTAAKNGVFLTPFVPCQRQAQSCSSIYPEKEQ
jgi:hypothetical protein